MTADQGLLATTGTFLKISANNFNANVSGRDWAERASQQAAVGGGGTQDKAGDAGERRTGLNKGVLKRTKITKVSEKE